MEIKIVLEFTSSFNDIKVKCIVQKCISENVKLIT